MSVFRKRGLVLHFPSRLPLVREIAYDIDAGFGTYSVDKIFYAGNGLFEVLFHVSKDRDLFLSTPSILL